MLQCKKCEFKGSNLYEHIVNDHKMMFNDYVGLYGKECTMTPPKPPKKKRTDGYVSVFSKKYWLDKGFTEEDAIYQIKIRRPSNTEYWINKGFDMKAAIIKVYEFGQSGFNKDKLIEKHGIVKGTLLFNERKEKKKLSGRTVQYWLNRNFSEVESIKKVHDTQDTTSLSYHIKKYGKKKGTKKREELTNKWQSTLNNKSKKEKARINKLKISNGVKFIKSQHPENWAELCLEKHFGYCKNGKHSHYTLLKEIINSAQSKEQLIIFLQKKDVEIRDLKFILKNELITEFYNIADQTEQQYIFNKICQHKGMKLMPKVAYGTRITFNGILYKSIPEYSIAKYLTDNNIKFEYDLQYPYQKKKWPAGFRYDFYIPCINLYIEYAGLAGRIEYDKKMIKKRNHCIAHNLSVFISNDHPVIIKLIENEIKKNN